jgi:hypothetical protein
MIGEFDKRSVSTVITSSDTRERAEETKTKWGLPNLKVGYGISIDKARAWGLYISSSRGMTSAARPSGPRAGRAGCGAKRRRPPS